MSETLTNADLDLSGVELTRPQLDNVTLRCKTGEVRLEDAEKKVVEEVGQATRLVIPLTLEESATGTQGQEVHVGFQITDSILLVPTGKMTLTMVKEKLARLQVAVLGLDKPTRLDVGDLRGKDVLVTFEAQADKNDPSIIRQRVKRYSKVV